MVVSLLTETVDDGIRGVGRRVVSDRPTLERLLLRGRDWYARSVVAARTAIYTVRYDAPIQPYRLVSVDPTAIEYVKIHPEPMFRNAGRVVDGNWDQVDDRFEEMDVFRAYQRHFEDGVPWQETAFYERIIGELEAGQELWGCTTRADFERRCRRLDDLYEAIAADGYRTQAELADGRVTDPIADRRALKTERFKNEIAVHVDRDGEFLFADGRNRLSIAKLLDLDSIPVRVLRRHADWQAVRDAYVRGDPAAEHLGDHPDIWSLDFGSGSAGLFD